MIVAVFIPPGAPQRDNMTEEIETYAHELEADAARDRAQRAIDTVTQTAEGVLNRLGRTRNGHAK
jgi:hypothetical protein